jgi:integrase
MTKQELGVSTIRLAVAASRSYFQKYDIDIISGKFKHKVTMPIDRKEDEYALGIEEIRRIITSINNRRLKAFRLILASAGMRPVEGLAIRYKDIDFSIEPTKLYMQAKYSKNKLPREIYITAEGTQFLNQWLAHKYRDKKPVPDDLVF